MLQVPTMPSSGLYRKPSKKQHRQRASKEDRGKEAESKSRVGKRRPMRRAVKWSKYSGAAEKECEDELRSTTKRT